MIDNETIIRKHAIEFINCHWNVPYNGKDKLIDYIAYINEIPNLTLDDYIELLKEDISECCDLLSAYAIENNAYFGYFGNKVSELFVQMGDKSDYYLVVRLVNYFTDSSGERSTLRKYCRLLIIGESGYTEVVPKEKTIQYYEAI